LTATTKAVKKLTKASTSKAGPTVDLTASTPPTKKGAGVSRPPPETPVKAKPAKQRRLKFIVQQPGSDEDAQSDDEDQFQKECEILPAKIGKPGKEGMTYSEPFRRIVYRHVVKLSVTEVDPDEFANVCIAYIQRKKGTTIRSVDGISFPIEDINWVCQILRTIGTELTESTTCLVTKSSEACRVFKEKALWSSRLSIGLYAVSDNPEAAVLRFARVFDSPKKGQKFEKKPDQLLELEVAKYYSPLVKVLADIQAFEKTRTKKE
jgi:hypothetical protein